jgi:HSP20 family protein
MVDFRSLVPWRDKSQPALPRDDAYDPFTTFRREVDRLFEDFFGGGRALASPLFGGHGVTPSIDMAETDTEVIITAELPGLEEKDFQVTVSGDVLTIKGEKKAEHEQTNGDTRYMERRYGAFSRSLRLPFAIGEEKVDAQYNKGILTIRLPKPAELQKPARKIDGTHGLTPAAVYAGNASGVP